MATEGQPHAVLRQRHIIPTAPSLAFRYRSMLLSLDDILDIEPLLSE